MTVGRLPRRARSAATLATLAAGVLAAAAAVAASGAGAGERIAYLRFTDPFWQVWVMSSEGRDPKQVTRSPGDKLRLSWFPGGRRLLYCVIPGQVWSVDVATGLEARVPLDPEGTTDAQVSPDGTRIAYSTTTGGGIDNNDLWVARAGGGEPRRLVADRGLQHYPTWSPDGREIVFLSGEGKNDHDVWRVDVASGLTTRIAGGLLYHFDLAVSSTRRIAMSSNRSGDYDVWVMEWDGSGARAIAAAPGVDSHPDWSPDGRRLLFTSSRQGVTALWIVGADGRGLRRLTPEGQRCRAGVFSR